MEERINLSVILPGFLSVVLAEKRDLWRSTLSTYLQPSNLRGNTGFGKAKCLRLQPFGYWKAAKPRRLLVYLELVFCANPTSMKMGREERIGNKEQRSNWHRLHGIEVRGAKKTRASKAGEPGHWEKNPNIFLPYTGLWQLLCLRTSSIRLISLK